MFIRIRHLSNPLIASLLILILLNPLATASASAPAALPTILLKPATLVTSQGSTVGSVASLRTMDQSGLADTPTKYVLFQTPGTVYKGYRTFNVPTSVSPGTISGIAVRVNYKGPAKAAQTWSWYLYDWVHSAWVKVGDNTGAALNVWKLLQFNAPADVRRFVNNTTRQIRLEVVSSNSLYDAKLDYEGITLTYASCTDALGCVLVRPGETMHIGYLLNLPSLEGLNGAQVAANDAATILGHPIQLDGFSAPNCDNAVAQTKAAQLLKDASILAILGTHCSGEAMAVMPAVSAAGFSMVSPSNTSPTLTNPGTAGYFRVSWSDDAQGRMAAAYAMLGLGLTKAATIADGSPYSTALVQSFVTRFQDEGGGTITAQSTINSGDIDFRAMLEAIATDPDGAPDVVYMPFSMPAAGYIINQARVTTGLGSVYLMGSDWLMDPTLLLSTGGDLEGFLLTAGPDINQFNQPKYLSFKSAYYTMFSSDPSENAFAPYGYDAFSLIKAAIEAAAEDPGDGSYLIGRQSLRDKLYATTDLSGITGTLTCHSNGECGSGTSLAVYRYARGADKPSRTWPVLP